MTIIDTHAHLDHLENVTQALEEAHLAGVVGVVTVGVDLASNRKNLELKNSVKNPQIFVALGIHPGNIHPAEVESCIQFIREHITEAVAIGETGLDYWYPWVKKNFEKKQEQQNVFHRQLDLAKEFDLPVVIHSRGAWKDCLEMTKEAGVKEAVFHWYSGPLDVLSGIMDNGYYVSTTPSLAYSPQSRAAITHAPIERTLIETDCPVFFKDGEDGFKAEPKDVFRTLKAYCALKEMEEREALEVFNKNARNFFNFGK